MIFLPFVTHSFATDKMTDDVYDVASVACFLVSALLGQAWHLATHCVGVLPNLR